MRSSGSCCRCQAGAGHLREAHRLCNETGENGYVFSSGFRTFHFLHTVSNISKKYKFYVRYLQSTEDEGMFIYEKVSHFIKSLNRLVQII